MKLFYSLSVLLLAATSLAAQEGAFSGGVTLTTNYVSNGETQTDDGPAIQPWLEYKLEKFYVGTWLSNVDFEGNKDNVEIDLYLGVRDLQDNGFFYDAGYARYLYDDTGDCCGEFKLTLGYDYKKVFAVNAYSAYNPDSKTFNNRLSFAAKPAPKFAVSGTYGWREVNDNEYYHAGVSYSINDHMALDVRYHGAEIGFDGVVASLAFFTSGTTFERMVLDPFKQ